MYRIVASDMDETFLASDHSIPVANVRALRRMRDAGILFVPASGRAYGSIMGSLAPVRELLEGSYVISYNGGCVNRVGNSEPITAHTLPFEAVERIFEWGKPYDIGFHVYELAGRCWGFRLSAAERGYLAGHMDISDAPGESVEFLRDVPIAKMLYVRPDLAYLHDLSARMPPEAYAGAWTTFSSGRYLEFNPVGVDKGAGLADLANLLGIPMADTVGCGDAANDLQLIEAAGCGVAVANATPDLAAAANYQAASTCDDGVLAEVVANVLRLAPETHTPSEGL